MHDRLTALVCTLALASATVALPALADTTPIPGATDEPDDTVGTEVCGHVGEMNAARVALQENRREDALRHLKKARSILVACDARLAAETEGRTPALSI